jgi:hypothetical protein
LHPERIGNFVAKRMAECNGAEILQELCAHLNFETQTHDDDTVWGVGVGAEAHVTFGRGSTGILGESSGTQSSGNAGLGYVSWTHSEGWHNYQITVGAGLKGVGYTQMLMHTVTSPF